MFSVEEDEVDEASNPLKENVVPQSVTNSDSSSLKNNSKFRTSSSSSSVAITKQCKNDTTKALRIICNIQFSIQNSGITDINNHMKTKKHQYCLKSAESNKCNVFPIDFNKKYSSRTWIIEFIEQQHESADGLFVNIKYVLESHGLELEKVSSLGSDNTNLNVGNNHSVFSLFNELIPRLIRGNCYCHVLHNSVKHGNNHLLFDVEAAILKIYSQFCRSSVRSQELGKYFEFVDQEQIVMKYI
ncbi:unnamed protein product [Rotaria sp. Silwood2]|nr:unnamed protein product [Rotaria sp. Silwood2]